MEKMKIVAVTQRIKFDTEYQEYRDELDHRYIDWVLASGHIPVPIPNSLLANEKTGLEAADLPIYNWLLSMSIDAILLTGGNNIGEFIQRDNTEIYLLSWAEANTVPVLGICRGMQLMGLRAGSELNEVSGHVNTEHPIHMGLNRQAEERLVNSYHNYSINCCPGSYELLASSEDGYPEAMKHKSLPWEAWMWHPERVLTFYPGDLARFKELIQGA